MNDEQIGDGVRARRRAWSRAVPGGVGAVVLAAFATAVAGCGSVPASGRSADAGSTGTATGAHVTSASDTAAPLASGQVGSRQDIPWARVGQGWFLADWSRSKPHSPGQHAHPSLTTLFLVDPAGGRYSITTFPADAGARGIPETPMAWSGDGQRALLFDGAGTTVLDLRTGVGTRLNWGSDMTPLGFTSPDGLAIIAAAGLNSQRLERFSLAGTKELTYPVTFTAGAKFWGGALDTPDGTHLVVGTTGDGVALMSNDGKSVRYLPVSPSVQGCSPLKWWLTNVVLARCGPKQSASGSQLWVVPASGATPTPLTARHPARGDLGDLNAWALLQGTHGAPIGTYVQDAGACGYTYVAKLGPSGRTTPINIPTTSGSTYIIGAQAGQLAVTYQPPCGDGGALIWFKPLTNTVTPILGGAMNHGSVGGAVMFGQS
ncbi:MAG TPA: hypothetical protein VGS19_20115 [Streptosporangiaceae bacterium]|nr:hypothetical protein [Streptosporangiaceae bacterium]